MKKLLFLLLVSSGVSSHLYAQSAYSQHEVVTTGLNVPNQMVFNTDGVLFVANHTYASYTGEYSNTIARIDESGNKSVFVSGYMWPSGLSIDRDQNLFFDQNNAGTTVYKVTPAGDISTFVNLPHQPGCIVLHDSGDSASFALYTVSHWGSFQLYKTGKNGIYTLFNDGGFYGSELSPDGSSLYVTTRQNNLMLKFNTADGLSQEWNTHLYDYEIWASTTGPDGNPYFIARSLVDTNMKSVYRIKGYNDETEIVANMPRTNEFNDMAFKKRGDVYDLYLTEVVNHDRMNPEANRVIAVRDVFKFERLPGAAGPVSGPDRVCQGESEVQFSVDPVTNATGYTWDLPPGFSITEGENTNSIRVTVSETAISGMVTVYGTNTDGIGPASPPFSIIVHSLPADLGKPINPPVDLQTGLVAYYPFNGNANDESGHENNAVEIFGGVSFEEGKFGPAAKFAGYDNPGHIKVSNSPSLQFLSEASFAVWVRLDDSVGMDGWGQYSMNGIHSIIAKNHDRHGYFEEISYNHMRKFVTGAGYDFHSLVGDSKEITDYSIGDWLHLTYVYTDSTSSVYINGMIDSTSHNVANFAISNQLDLYFGKFIDYWYPFNGALDEVRIYNRALTAEEVACLYNGECSNLYLSANLTENNLCRGGSTSLQLINAQPGIKYQLFNGEYEYCNFQVGNSDTLNFPIDQLYETTSFTIMATDTATGCSLVLDSVFRVNVVPVEAQIEASLSSDYAPAVVTLNSTSAYAASWNWTVNGEFLSSSEQTQLELTEPGEYQVVLQVIGNTPFQCTDADTIALNLMERINVIFEFPSAFSPNGDGYNDVFVPLAEGVDAYSVTVKDPWGRTMAAFDRISPGWNGKTTGGAEAPAGAYYYQSDATDYNGLDLERSGVVYLIRDLIDLSPNPAKDKLVIKMNGRLPGERSLRIFSANGMLVLNQLVPDQNELVLDISRLRSGLYKMIISNEFGNQAIIFIKY